MCVLDNTTSWKYAERWRQLLPEAGAQRTLEAVSYTPMFGVVIQAQSHSPCTTLRSLILPRCGTAAAALMMRRAFRYSSGGKVRRYATRASRSACVIRLK